MKKLVSMLLVLIMLCTAAASVAAGDSGEKYEIYLKIDFAPNLMFSLYGVDVSIDGTSVSSLSHGQDWVGFLRLSRGEHVLKFVNSGNSAVSGTWKFTLTADSQMSCKINAYSGHVGVSEQVITPYPRVGSGAPASDGTYRLEYSVDFDENNVFSRYDVNMEIDGVHIAKYYHGADGGGAVNLAPGPHHITFRQDGHPSNYKHFFFVLEGDAVFSCGMHAYDSNLTLKNPQIKAAQARTAASSETASGGADSGSKAGSSSGSKGGTIAEVESKVMDAVLKKALLLELDTMAEMLNGQKGRAVAAALVSLLKSANEIEFGGEDDGKNESKKEIPDGANKRAAEYGALITDGETLRIYRALLKKEGYDLKKVFPDMEDTADDTDTTVAGIEEKAMDAGVEKALLLELDTTAKLLKGRKGRPVAAALASLLKTANGIDSDDGSEEKENTDSAGNNQEKGKETGRKIPDSANRRAAEYGAMITDVDTQLIYCELLKKEGYDLAKVYPEGVEVDIDLRQYQLYSDEGEAAARGNERPDCGKVLIFSREDRDVPQMTWIQTVDESQLDAAVDRAREARKSAAYGYRVTLRVDLMASEKLNGRIAQNLAECTSYVIIDKGYRCCGRYGYNSVRSNEPTEYFTGLTYRAIEAIAAYRVSDPAVYVLWYVDYNEPLISTNCSSVLDRTQNLAFVFIYTDANGKECRDTFLATNYTGWNIPKYMVGQFKTNWADEYLKREGSGYTKLESAVLSY